MKLQRVYMMTDLEGVAGVDDWDIRHYDYATTAKGVFERSEMQRLLTGEVNAACSGLFAAGVEEIVINDAHGAGRTILPEEMPSGVRLVKGINRPCWLPGLDRGIQALVQIGMHAMTGTPAGCLAHSMSRNLTIRVNGKEVGEMQMAAFLCGTLGIPWIFTSGDLHACRESEAWVPGIVTADVKEGLGERCAIHRSPIDARQRIKDQIQRAVKQLHDYQPLTLESPVTMEIQRPDPWPAQINPGAERVDAFTLRCQGNTFWEVFHNYFHGKPDFPLP